MKIKYIDILKGDGEEIIRNEFMKFRKQLKIDEKYTDYPPNLTSFNNI